MKQQQISLISFNLENEIAEILLPEGCLIKGVKLKVLQETNSNRFSTTNAWLIIESPSPLNGEKQVLKLKILKPQEETGISIFSRIPDDYKFLDLIETIKYGKPKQYFIFVPV